MSAPTKAKRYALKKLQGIHNISPQAAMLEPCPKTGGGVHTWLLRAANSCRIHGLSKKQTETWLEMGSSHCGRVVPQREINDALRAAWAGSTKGKGKPQPRATYSPGTLQALAGKVPDVDEAWFRSKSPIDPAGTTPREFLEAIFQTGEIAAVLMGQSAPKTSMWCCGGPGTNHLSWPTITNCVKNPLFLSNPIDGKRHYNPRTEKMSDRSQESVTSFRYAVLESDQAPACLWLPAIAQLDLPIAAVYTSGGKSVHALWRVDADSKEDWDAKVEVMKPRLVTLGADPDALTAVRLTRLPGCMRRSTGNLQKLLYLNPSPTISPLTNMPVIR